MFLGASLLLFSCESLGTKPRASNPNFLADMDPLSIGSVSMQFDKFLSSSLEKKDAEVWLDPRTDSVYIQFRYQAVTFKQFWDKSNRLQFITALEKYKKDYEAKNLNLKGSRAGRAYGILDGRTQWKLIDGSLISSENSESRPKIGLGYQFKQNSPYFTVQQAAAENLLGTSDEQRESLALSVYFTRAQAEELAKLFDQQYLLSLLGRRPAPADPAPAQDTDYREGNLQPPATAEYQEAEGE
jgi:hypothetical protein